MARIPFAQKYGISKDLPANSVRSQLTPTEILYPTKDLDALNQKHKDDVYQINRLFGFSTRELVELDAISDRKLKKPNLPYHAIPFLDLNPPRTYNSNEQIESGLPPFVENESVWNDGRDAAPPYFNEPDVLQEWQKQFPMVPPDLTDPDNAGLFWTPANPRVRELLEPVVTLATRMLQNSSYTPFYDAIAFANRRPVAKDRIPPMFAHLSPKLFTLSPNDLDPARTPSSQDELEKSRQRIHNQLVRYLRIGFVDRRLCPFTRTFEASWDGAYGFTMVHPSHNPRSNIWIFLNTGSYKSLLRSDLTDSERLGMIWINAITLVHEVAHAYEMFAYMTKHVSALGGFNFDSQHTTYYKDDSVSEMGTAMEHHVGEGCVREMIVDENHQYIAPLGFWRETVWNTTHARKLQEPGMAPILLQPPLKKYQELYPIPVALLEDVQQEDFWQTITRFKGGMHEMRSLTIGTHVTLNDAGDDVKWDELHHDIQTHLQKIEQLMTLNPAQRDLVTAGSRFLESAKAGRSFFDQVGEELSETQAILDELQKFPKDYENRLEQGDQTIITRWNNFFDQIERTLENVTQAHLEKADALLKWERTQIESLDDDHRFYKTQRNDLSIFNRGTERFLLDLRAQLEVFGRVSGSIIDARLESISEAFRDLELSRLRLWAPQEPPIDMEQIFEEEMIRAMDDLITNSQFKEAEEKYEQITTGFPALSTWTHARATILYNLPEMTPKRSINEKLRSLAEARDEIVYLRDGPHYMRGVPTWWLETFMEWLEKLDLAVMAYRRQRSPSRGPNRERRRSSSPPPDQRIYRTRGLIPRVYSP